MNLVKRVWAAAAAFFFAGGALFFAGASVAAEETTATPAMWRAADADTEIFLLGTFHILPKNVQWRTSAFETAFDAADIVYFEVEADAADIQSKTLGVMMTEGFNPNGAMLTDMLAEDDAAALREIVTSLGLPFQGVNPMRPWNAFLTLSVQFIVQQGFDPGAGVDSVLLAEARTKGKELRFFETIDEQLALFTGLAPETEKKLLELTIRDWDNQAESFDDLYEAWRTGDGASLDAQMNEIMRDQAPEVFERILVARNEAWANEIERLMGADQGAVFIAVGAAHLVGDRSVQSILKTRGIEFTRYGDEPTAANDNTANDDEAVAADGIGDLLKAVGEN